jgi:hypothetical protein
MITQQRDTDILVLLKLNDNDLINVCLTSKRYQNICNDDYFWRLKVVNYVGKDQEKHNAELKLKHIEDSDDSDGIILVDYERILEVKMFLEFSTWKEFYIFILKNHIFAHDFINTELFKTPKYNEKNLPTWINAENFYVEYKRYSFIGEERNASYYMIQNLKNSLDI